MRLKKFLEHSNPYYDDPRKAIVTLSDYNDIVNKVKSVSNDEEISELIEDYILENEPHLADIVIGEDSDYIYCEHGAEMTSQILSDAGIKHKIQVGDIHNKQSHAWVLLNDTIIDPTKSQFRGIGYSDYQGAGGLSDFPF